jgi:hypothetical protein
MIYKHSVRTAKKTQHFTVTKMNWLMQFKKTQLVSMTTINWLTLFSKTNADYSENDTGKCRVVEA